MSAKPAVPLEATIVAATLKKLNALPGCRAKKHHGTAFGALELDIRGCYRGLAFYIEMKRPGGKLSERQVVEIAKWKAVGAASGVAYSPQEALGIIFKRVEEWRASFASADQHLSLLP